MKITLLLVNLTTGVLFLLFLLLYWHVLSPHFILTVKTRIIFKSLNEVCKQPLSGILSETAAVVKTRPITFFLPLQQPSSLLKSPFDRQGRCPSANKNAQKSHYFADYGSIMSGWSFTLAIKRHRAVGQRLFQSADEFQ